MRLATVLVFLWFTDALAEPATARLEFVRTVAAAGCGDQAALREGVRRRLGVDPFVEDAKRLVSVRIDADADTLVARIDVVQEGRRARRTLRSSRRDCADLSAAVELSVSLAVDPQWRPSPPPSEDPPPEEPVTAAAPAPFPALGKESSRASHRSTAMAVASSSHCWPCTRRSTAPWPRTPVSCVPRPSWWSWS